MMNVGRTHQGSYFSYSPNCAPLWKSMALFEGSFQKQNQSKQARLTFLQREQKGV